MLYTDVSEHSVPSSFYTYPLMKMEQSVPKRRHIKFRRRWITQKKAYKVINRVLDGMDFAEL